MSSTNADRVASGPLAAGSVPKEVTWDGLDKRKFFVVGAGMFSCVTCALYPLTVIKTRQMVDGSVPGGGRPPPALSISVLLSLAQLPWLAELRPVPLGPVPPVPRPQQARLRQL